MKKIFFAVAFSLFAASISSAAEPSVEVAVVATSVEKHIPIGVAEKFPSSVGRLYCYSKIIKGEGQEIKHLWYMNEKLFSQSALTIISNSYRTYSGATIQKTMKGKGRVDIVTAEGKVIKTVEFEIE